MVACMTTNRDPVTGTARVRTTQVNFACPIDLLDQVDAYAHRLRMPRAAAIRHLLVTGMEINPDNQLPGQTSLGGTP
jgi:hypothetical protein